MYLGKQKIYSIILISLSLKANCLFEYLFLTIWLVRYLSVITNNFIIKALNLINVLAAFILSPFKFVNMNNIKTVVDIMCIDLYINVRISFTSKIDKYVCHNFNTFSKLHKNLHLGLVNGNTGYIFPKYLTKSSKKAESKHGISRMIRSRSPYKIQDLVKSVFLPYIVLMCILISPAEAHYRYYFIK